jgi:hypothetical protein
MIDEAYLEIQRHEARADSYLDTLREKEKMLDTCTNDLTQMRSRIAHAERVENEMEKMCEIVNDTRQQLRQATDEVSFRITFFKNCALCSFYQNSCVLFDFDPFFWVGKPTTVFLLIAIFLFFFFSFFQSFGFSRSKKVCC